MSINRKFFTAITLAIAVFALSTFVSAQETKTDKPFTKEGHMGKRGEKGIKGEYGKRGKHGKHRGHGLMRSLHGVELSETQQTQIKSIFEANKSSFQTQHEEMKGLMMKKRDGSLTDADKSRLEQFKIERKAAAEQMDITIMALLTPEQTAKVNQMKVEREQRMQERKLRWQERKQETEKPKDNK